MKWIIYCTTNLVNNKIYYGVHKTENPDVFDGYIGCGVKINNPSSYMNPTTPFQAAVKKYGTANFRRVVEKIFDNPKDAYEFESIIVDSNFIKRKDVYNSHLGGLGGSSYYRKVYQYSLNGDYIKEWDSILDAADFYFVSDTAIRNACEVGYTSKGFFWSFDKLNNIDVSGRNINKGTPCYKYDGETGKFIESYDSLAHAAKTNNIRLMIIERAVKGGYKCKGFYYSTIMCDIFTPEERVSLKGKAFYLYDLNGNYVMTLDSQKTVCEYFNLKNPSSFITAVRTGRQYKDYQISLEKVEKMNPVEDRRNKSKKVGQYTMGGEFVAEFNSITEAQKIFGAGVSKVLRGQQSHCKHYLFRYL